MGTKYDRLFEELSTVLSNHIHWYQGGADDALRAILERGEDLAYLLQCQEVSSG